MKSCKPVVSPGTSVQKKLLDGDEELSKEDHGLFRKGVGKLMWLLPIRPDLSFAVKELARSLQGPTSECMSKLKHVLRYLQGTKGFKHKLRPSITLPSYEKPSPDIIAYVDSDWAGCHTTRRSTSGGVLQILGSTFHHFSRTQATVALSSAEAELCAITSGVAEALGFRSLLQETELFTNINLHAFTDSHQANQLLQETALQRKQNT